MKGNGIKSPVILAVCGWGLWKMGGSLFGPAVTPGKVAMLTDSNYREVQKSAATLLAIYTRPG